MRWALFFIATGGWRCAELRQRRELSAPPANGHTDSSAGTGGDAGGQNDAGGADSDVIPDSATDSTSDRDSGGASVETPVIPIGLDGYRHWHRLPYLRIGTRAYMRSTYDRAGNNETADASHFLRQEAVDRNVTLDVAGPGVLYFVRTNHWHGSPWHYVVDGTDHLVQETSTADPTRPVEGSVFLPEAPFPNPLTWTWSLTRGADLNWVPMPFERSFTLAYGRTHYGTGYYIYHLFPEGRVEPVRADPELAAGGSKQRRSRALAPRRRRHRTGWRDHRSFTGRDRSGPAGQTRVSAAGRRPADGARIQAAHPARSGDRRFARAPFDHVGRAQRAFSRRAARAVFRHGLVLQSE